MAVWWIDALMQSYFGWSPVDAFRRFANRSLPQDERERLLELEDAEANRMMLIAEQAPGTGVPKDQHHEQRQHRSQHLH